MAQIDPINLDTSRSVCVFGSVVRMRGGKERERESLITIKVSDIISSNGHL